MPLSRHRGGMALGLGRAAMEQIQTRCCIVGGGPAGVMLGYLLARAGVGAVVLEKHADFLRDFRGDTVHPSTLDVLHELGLLERFLRLPHTELREIRAHVGAREIPLADFGHASTRCQFLAFMPQWDFLSFLVDSARPYDGFKLRMRTEVTELIREGSRVVGVAAQTPRGPCEIRADVVVGCDGRHSTVRALAGLEATVIGAPNDVLWLRLSKNKRDPSRVLGYFEAGRVFIMLDRGDYWQCGFVIRKGELGDLKARGLGALRGEIARIVPFVADRVGELRSWEDLQLLTVQIDRLRRWWRPGVLCIGDAAHSMSPIGGVGINLAIQDAVATANLLAEPLRKHTLTSGHLEAVQRRRAFPTRVTQDLQVFIQNRMWPPNSDRARGRLTPTALQAMALFEHFAWLRRIPARLIGVGVRPEHVSTPS
jgi:2-polyprenyl-6-methoxyphenol hydroxylase-like FAD-dependent oxidoreductase